jgi:hypothetical protein
VVFCILCAGWAVFAGNSLYIEHNPVRAKPSKDPRVYPRSSTAAHTKGYEDGLVVVKPLQRVVDD